LTAAAPLLGDSDRTVVQVAQNVSTRYLAYVVDAAIGLVMLPFNLAHLGLAAYGLWILTTSVTAYFAMLDLGYGGALVRFVARYRAQRDVHALNEVLSTLSVVYAAIGAITYGLVLLVASNLALVATLTPAQVATSRLLLLIIGANVALRFFFGVFGGVIVGFQRYHLNNLTSVATSLIVAAANVAVLLAGYGVVELVAVTTAVRVLALFVYRLNAYRVFPGLSIDWRLFRRERLREITGFSVFMLILDGAYKLNYSTDVLIIGAFMGAPAVALWAPAMRLSEVMLKLSNQLADALFPIVVDCDARQSPERLRLVFLQGTRLSLATVLPVAGGTAMLAQPLLQAWIGPAFGPTAIIAQLLALVVIVRVGVSTSSVILKGAGAHRRLVGLVSLMAVGNIALSIALVRSLGLLGVAIGTLVSVVVVSIFGLIPAACRRVEVSVLRFVREAVWPALWPIAITGLLIMTTRAYVPETLFSVAAQLAVSGVAYLCLFMVAVGRTARREYMQHAAILLRPRAAQVAPVGTANAS
jgi:O-antigen/teichoic acid export membrane protein